MTMRFAVTPGSATPDEDYEIGPQRPVTGGGIAHRTGTYADATVRSLTFAAGQASAQVLVRTMDDDEDEEDETLTLNVSSVLGTSSRVTATGMIMDNDYSMQTRAFEAVLASFGRTVAGEAVNVLGERFSEAGSEDRVTLGGHALSLGGGATPAASAEEPFFDAGVGASGRADAGGEGPASMRELAARSSFVLSVGPTDDAPDAPGAWTLWGRAGVARFSGRPASDLETDGEVFTGFVGVDARLRPDVLTGVAVARSRGDMGYRLADERADVDAALTSVFPYAHWKPSDGLGVWAMAGAGWGEAMVKDEAGSARTAIEMRMAALGWRKELGGGDGDGDGDGDVSWALKGDGLAVEMESDEAARLHATKPAMQRLRLLMEAAAEWPLGAQGRLRPRLEFGGRWDGGRFGKGYGAEAGGGVTYADARLGLEAEARGRYLLAHQSAGFEESGAGLALRFDPRGDGVGPWFELSPQWGAPEGGAESLWGSLPGGDADAPASRLGLGAGWRFDEALGASVTFDREAAGDARSYGLGVGWTPRGEPGGAPDVSVEVEASRREGETDATEHRIGLQLRLNW